MQTLEEAHSVITMRRLFQEWTREAPEAPWDWDGADNEKKKGVGVQPGAGGE